VFLFGDDGREAVDGGSDCRGRTTKERGVGSGKLAPTLLIFHVGGLHSDRRFQCRDIVLAGDIYGKHWIRVWRKTTRYVTALRGRFLKERRKSSELLFGG